MLWYKILWLKSFKKVKLKNYIRNKTVVSIKTKIVHAMSKTMGISNPDPRDFLKSGDFYPGNGGFFLNSEDFYPGDWGFLKIWGFLSKSKGFLGMEIFRGWDFFSWDGISHQKATSGYQEFLHDSKFRYFYKISAIKQEISRKQNYVESC